MIAEELFAEYQESAGRAALRPGGLPRVDAARATLVTAACHPVPVGIERSAARKKRDNQRAARSRAATTSGGPVVTRKVGDPAPQEAPPAPRREPRSA